MDKRRRHGKRQLHYLLPQLIRSTCEGDCKSAGRSFVERYNGQGVVTFLDGHAESVSVKDLLTETGRLFYPQTNIVWTRTPDEDPNPESAK